MLFECKVCGATILPLTIGNPGCGREKSMFLIALQGQWAKAPNI